MVPDTRNGRSGTKTPRRVQWTSDSHIASTRPIPAMPCSSSGTLDETNINEVRAALEQHHRNPKKRRPPRPVSTASTASSADEIQGGTDEDYDYRLDIDPPGEPLEAQTTVDSAGSNTERRNLENILDNGINEHVTAHIGLGETDGLPNVRQDEKQDELNEARNIVRAHTGKWGVLRRRVRGAGAVNRAFAHRKTSQDPEKAANDQDAFASRYPEPDDPSHRDRHEHGNHLGMPPIPGGASVLSSLLALYGQLPSRSTSVISSRASSDSGESDTEERRRQLSDDSNHRDREVVVEQSNAPESDAHPDIINHKRRPSQAGEHPLDTHHPSESAPSLSNRSTSPRFRRRLDDAIIHLHDRRRPKSARSGAGVIGALIQETGNISGAATPAASALTPAASRPGYQLSRYSVPDVNIPASTALDHPWRPHSRQNSRPASIHSSTAVSRDGESPSDDRAFHKIASSDDMLVMKNEKKRPKETALDSLGRFSGRALKESGQALKQTEKWILSGGKTPLVTPPEAEYFSRPLTEDERRRKEWEAEKKRRKRQKEARKKQEIFVSCDGTVQTSLS